MANPKGKKPGDLPPMKRGAEFAKKNPTATSTKIRTCGNCSGNGCVHCNRTGKIHLGLIT